MVKSQLCIPANFS